MLLFLTLVYLVKIYYNNLFFGLHKFSATVDICPRNFTYNNGFLERRFCIKGKANSSKPKRFPTVSTCHYLYYKLIIKSITTVNIWKSYMWTVKKDVNRKGIFAVMNTSWAVVKMRTQKIQACMGFEPMTSSLLLR